MISRYTYQSLIWIDLENPTREEISALSEEYGLHPVIENELLAPSERAKIDLYENAMYLILHFPVKNRMTGAMEEAEVDFVLTKTALITTHYTLVDPLHDFAKLFEVGSYLESGKIGTHAGFLFFFAIRELYRHTLFLLEGVGKETRAIEKHIFSGNESAMVEHISKTNRALIDIRQTLRYHKDTLLSFREGAHRMYGDDFTYYAGAIEGEYGRIEQAVRENRHTMRDLRETNDSLLSSKSTATIKRLTAVNVIMLPLGLITWIFAMHSTYLNLDDPKKLLLVFAAMAGIGVLSILYFRSNKWL